MAKRDARAWRLNRDLQTSLEEMARRRQMTVAELLERINQEWLAETAGRRPGLAQASRRAAGDLVEAVRGEERRRAAVARPRPPRRPRTRRGHAPEE